MVAVALLSNPTSTGNRDLLPRIRGYCARQPEIFHYEVDQPGQTGEALKAIAQVQPRVLVINGGDGTVQAALTELYHGDYFSGGPPPVAVLPNGKTNLIALDLGSVGDPLVALERILDLARTGLGNHIVERELISLTSGDQSNRAVLGMFLGGAGLADAILYCRHKIYPLGLPNGFSHVLAAIAVFFGLFSRMSARFLPPPPRPLSVSTAEGDAVQGRFSLLIVTTLERLVLGASTGTPTRGLRLLSVEQSGWALLRAMIQSVTGRLGARPIKGLHISNSPMIRIESDDTSVILDGEEFHARRGWPIVLQSTAPMNFLHLAA